jgi:MFS family permease
MISVLSLIGLASLHLFMPVLAPILMQAAGQPPEAFGWVGGALYLGAVWMFVANSAFTPTLGPIRALQVGSVIAATGALLTLVGDMLPILIGAALMGFGYASTTPAGAQILTDHTPKAYRSTLFSIRQAAVPLGGIVAGTAGSALISAFGWRIALSILAAVCIAVCLLLFLAPRSLNESGPRKPFRIAALLSLHNVAEPFRIVAAVPGLVRLALACIGFAAVQGATVAFYVIFLTVGLGLDLKLAGLLFASMQASSVTGRVILGLAADRIGSPMPVMKLLSFTSCLSALSLAAMTPDWPLWGLFAASVFAGFSVSTWNGLYLAEIANITPAERVSEATAGTTFFVFATYAATPPIAGILIRLLGYRAMFAIMAIAACLPGLVLYGFRTPRPKE